MTDEKAVASFYERTTATFCAPVASTLALRLSDWDSLLVWTQSVNVSGYAIADGFLKVTDERTLAEKETQLKETMGEEMFRLLQTFSTDIRSLMTSEFKNMAAGGPEVMLEIPNLSDLPSFDWTGCESPDCASNTYHAKERKKVTEASMAMGPDAKNTPWTLTSDRETVRLQPLTLPQPHEIGEPALASVLVLLPASVPLVSTGRSSIQGSSEDAGTSKAMKQKQDESRASSLLSTLVMLFMTPQANSSLAPEASSAPENPPTTMFQGPEPRRSDRIAAIKKQKPNDPINVCSSVL